LHGIGVTAMFVASKYEDIYPLKMKTVYDKIAH
jgi:cyclin B/cyclin A